MHLNPVFFWHYILLFFCADTHNNWQVSLSVSYIHRQRLYCLSEGQSLRMFSSCFFPFPSEEEELRRAAPSPCKSSLRNAWQCDLEFLWSLSLWILYSVYIYAVYARVTILFEKKTLLKFSSCLFVLFCFQLLFLVVINLLDRKWLHHWAIAPHLILPVLLKIISI